jgi:hypothetical protein
MNQKSVKTLLVLCVIVATLTISGCVTSPGKGGAGGPGLVIEKFETSLQQIDSGEDVNLHLEVRNRGDYSGPMGRGVPAAAELMEIDPYEWFVQPSTIINLGELVPPDIESQTEGGLGTADWVLKAPLLKKGERKTYNIIARVYYPYETRVIKPVLFVTAEELRRIVQTGGALSSEPQTQTAGPLTVIVRAGNFVKANEYKDSKFDLQIIIENTGGGRIEGVNYPVAVSVDWPQWVTPLDGNCPKEIYWITPEFKYVPSIITPISGNYVYLWDGKRGEITCQFSIVQPPSERTIGNFKVNVDYIYSVDAITQITVRGTEEF